MGGEAIIKPVQPPTTGGGACRSGGQGLQCGHHAGEIRLHMRALDRPGLHHQRVRLPVHAELETPALRDEALVSTRRDGTTIFYRIADPSVLKVIAVLAEIYCPPVSSEKA